MSRTRHNGGTAWMLVGFLAIALFFLLSEHRAHFLGTLPYLLVLACPLLHFLGHAGHGRSSDHSTRGPHDTLTGGKP